jgi:hypothetical protein
MGSLMGMLGIAGYVCISLILPLALVAALLGIVTALGLLGAALGLLLCLLSLAVVWTLAVVSIAAVLLPLRACSRKLYPGEQLWSLACAPWSLVIR